MKMNFINTSSQKLNISVDNGSYISILPNERIELDSENKLTHNVSVKSATPSHYQNGFYYFNVITDYQIFESDENIEFNISCDNYSTDSCINLIKAKMCVENNECIFNSFSVENKEEIEKVFKRKRKTQIFFTDLFEYSQGELLIAILIGVAIFYFCGWKAGLIYSFLAYWLLVLYNYLSNKGVSNLFRKVLKVTDDKTDFYNFSNSNYLIQWFSDPENLSEKAIKEKSNKRRKRRFKKDNF